MLQPSLWGLTFRRVEEFFKRIITTGTCLCPVDSHLYGDAPWPCIVCVDIRRRMRGETNPRTCIVTGGKRRNARGYNTAWMLPGRVKCGECRQLKWEFPHPYTLMATAFMVLRRNFLKKTLGGGIEVTPMGIAVNGDKTGLLLHAESLETGKTMDYPVYHPKIRIVVTPSE